MSHCMSCLLHNFAAFLFFTLRIHIFATYFVPYFWDRIWKRKQRKPQPVHLIFLSSFPAFQLAFCTCNLCNLCNLEDLDVAHVEKDPCLDRSAACRSAHSPYSVNTQPISKYCTWEWWKLWVPGNFWALNLWLSWFSSFRDVHPIPLGVAKHYQSIEDSGAVQRKNKHDVSRNGWRSKTDLQDKEQRQERHRKT